MTDPNQRIAELLKYDPPYKWRGANLALIQSRDPEVMLSGPAETGKSYAACYKAHMACREYPGAQGALIRQVANTIPPTIFRTMKRVIGAFPVEYYGGEKAPSQIIYPNGSIIWLGGMDNPGKALSGERDFIQVCQAEELLLDGWETLSTRATGRGAVMPYTQLFGDCNPGGAKHFLLTRERVHMLRSRHEDNPTLYDDDGKITEQGKRSMAVLDALTGFRRKRLRDGLWVTVEGAVYEEFDKDFHVIRRDQLPKFVRRFVSIDFGYTNPFVCQWWGEDNDGRLYLYREIYQTHCLVEKLTKTIIELTGDEPIDFYVADHDAEDRATMEQHGIGTIPAIKDVSPGIQAVQKRLQKAGDGRSRIYFVKDALVSVDESLLEAHKPTCTIDEAPDYVWQKTQDGRPNKEQPVKVGDHGMDTMRYIVYALDSGADVDWTNTNGTGTVEGYNNPWAVGDLPDFTPPWTME